MITKQEAVERIASGAFQLPPLKIELQGMGQALAGYKEVDAVLSITWQDKSHCFGAEYSPRSTPKEFQSALDKTLRVNKVSGLQPMVLMPFLNERQLLELSDRKISGIDLSGNGVVLVPDQLFVFRNGAPNRFPASETIQNVYRKNSSIVPRVFLIQPSFDSVNSIQASVQRYGGETASVSLSTVSKVLKTLENDLIISREKGDIRLLQPEKLLEKLAANFVRPTIRRCLIGKSSHDAGTLMHKFSDIAVRRRIPVVGTGVGSAGQYAVVAKEDYLSVYCTDQYRLIGGIDFDETSRFPNLEIIETHDKTVYFDTHTYKSFEWASPTQTYLELMAGDQRERETAKQVKEVILHYLREGQR